jgi:hypothetical protein
VLLGSEWALGVQVGELPALREGVLVFLGQKGGCGSDLFGLRCRDALFGV